MLMFAVLLYAGCSERREAIGNPFDPAGDGAGEAGVGEAEGASASATGTASSSADPGGTASTAATGADTAAEAVDADTATQGHEDTSGNDSASSGAKFDVVDGNEHASGGDGEDEEGCEMVDFLFVVDNSGSMGARQTNLINSFGPFIDTIYDRLPAQDFRIMAVDSDAGHDIEVTCEPCDPDSFWCGDWCTVKSTLDVTCETTLGAGEVAPYNSEASNTICGVPDGKRYLTSTLTQTDIKDKFACIAKTGTLGSGAELPMTAMAEAVTTQDQPGGCNEGFVRDDAVLVVTIISDDIPTATVDNASTVGSPQEWFDAVVSAKRGFSQNIVMLAIVNNEHATCIGLTDSTARTGPTTRFLDFVAMFGVRGVVGNVCEPNYDAFFEQAVDLIEVACREFVPPPE